MIGPTFPGDSRGQTRLIGIYRRGTALE